MMGREEEECPHVYSAIPGFSESGCPRGRPQHLSPRFPNRNPHLPSIPKPARGHAGRAARESPTPLPTRLANGFSSIPRLGGGPARSPRAGDRGAGGGGPGWPRQKAAARGVGELTRPRGAGGPGGGALRLSGACGSPSGSCGERSAGGAGSGRDAPRDTQRKGSAAACCRPRRG